MRDRSARSRWTPAQAVKRRIDQDPARSARSGRDPGTYRRGQCLQAGLRTAGRAQGSLSSIYRLLAKAGWRKLAPRPSHPKKDPAAEAAFKKTLRRK